MINSCLKSWCYSSDPCAIDKLSKLWLILLIDRVTPPFGFIVAQVLSLPNCAKSLVTNSVAEYSAVLPYTIRLFCPVPAAPWLALVLFAHSCKLPYSSIEPPPTVKTIASLKPCLRCTLLVA
jgi:hypothetical protein